MAAVRPSSPSEVIRFGIGGSSLGLVLVASSDNGICCILAGDDPTALREDLRQRFPRARFVEGAGSHVADVVRWIDMPLSRLELPLDVRGTPFQLRVWQALCEIPAGSTRSYAAIAKQIGSPKSVRAVAGACAANPIAVAIPCHRVVRTDGHLSGYRWGIERKRALLLRERKA